MTEGSNSNADEALKRVVEERDKARQEAEVLGAKLIDLDATRKAETFFRDKGATDPAKAAEFALPHVRTLDGEDFNAKLEELAPMFATAAPAEPAETPPTAATTEPTAQPAAPIPSPGGDGTPVGTVTEKLTLASDKVQALIRNNDGAALQALIDSGELEPRYQDPGPRNAGMAPRGL
ncbi:MAG: hypothetical protein DWQ20_05970 [Actinobacteria bacterium]|nr:MAG: hypothetical protein DWQ20_05970 [Actinomycetota bacterium]